MKDYFICPNCGEEVPGKARACPHCGSDENTGWSDAAMIHDGGMEEEFDYEETVRREFGGPPKKSKKQIFYAVVAVIIVILFFLVAVRAM
jgi:RNA polymerase subunit RPABC4/transcription elongation factor Spt4